MAKLIHTDNELSAKDKSIKKVFGNEQSNIVNIQLKAGEGIPEHDSKNPIFIIVRSGTVKFVCPDEEYHLKDSDILYMEAEELHSVEAVTDTDFLVVFLK
ncbi:Cupin domain protein [Jeotgalicoccus saudimassiliensis]|uniref:Cupin domain protein n=1 Tax=Jeotgalicoccus saudimassiliensis TaxID=1461582 RepID=A0A078M4I1_9STAP|nr:cupin domain-containing protein [Jeotgalicoccus saudimassiliensis]CEA02403.1 Cupin domain protein [Jeotgalicoccus saudimassiliensis]